MPRYFSGTALGSVAALPQVTFADLCAEVIQSPVALSLTRAEYHALPKKDKKAPLDQDRVKKVRYLTPAVFKTSPSPRNYESASECNLLFLDIDDATEAQRLLGEGWDCLGDLAFVVWHTASSTPEKPRLRVAVAVEGLSVARYPAAIRSLGGLLGITEPTHESLVAVQPMFLPVQFAGESLTPIVAINVDGDPFLPIDVVDEDSPEDAPAVELSDLDFLRAPLEGITTADVEDALKHIDPDCPMQRWIEVAAGLKHQFGDAGLPLWDAWSARGKKYVDSNETEYRWSTLKANTPNRAPITIRSLFKFAQDAGWKNEALSRRARNELTEWITNSSRSTEELIDHGAKRIAGVAPMLGALERKALMSTLRNTLADRKMQVQLPDIRKEVHRIEVESARQSGFPAWAKGMCYVTALNVFYRYTTDRRFSPEVIDLSYATTPDSDVKAIRPRDFLIQVVRVPQVENLRYDPRQGDKRFFSDKGVPYVNIYRPSYAKPNADRAAEAGDVLKRHLGHLIREPEYRTLLLDFLAFQVQRPGIKIRWAPLVQSTKGAGKTALAVIMEAALGKGNVAKLTGSDVLNRTYNDWAYGSQLVVMEEVRVVGHNRHDVMDKIKPCITDDEVSLNCKYDPLRTVPNTTNYMLFTNHQDALAIQDDERRYFVIRSPLQRADDIAALGGDTYFTALYGAVRDNPGGFRAFFENWKISDAFKPDGRAPVTPYLRELAENASSPLAAAVRQAISEEAHPLVRRDLVSMKSLRDLVENLPGVPEFSDQGLASVLRELGWEKCDRVMLDGLRHQLWSRGPLANARIMATQRLELF